MGTWKTFRGGFAPASLKTSPPGTTPLGTAWPSPAETPSRRAHAPLSSDRSPDTKYPRLILRPFASPYRRWGGRGRNRGIDPLPRRPVRGSVGQMSRGCGCGRSGLRPSFELPARICRRAVRRGRLGSDAAVLRGGGEVRCAHRRSSRPPQLAPSGSDHCSDGSARQGSRWPRRASRVRHRSRPWD